ncbi:MAG: threonine--tRNA ligase [Parcubacteria group bacterium]
MNKDEKLSNLRHSLAHLLAAAVLDLWPDAKRAIGPAIENGFYYDFEFSKPISEEDIPKIEAKMKEILPTWSEFEKSDVSADEARKLFKDNPYKQELIDEYADEGLTTHKSGEYIDLCRGGHVDDAKEIDPDGFKLTHTAGAYWRGDEKNTMLTRIYGLAFETQKELEKHLEMLEEAKKRDHKKIGPQLDLFTFSDLVGSGLPLWTPKGTLLRNILDDFVWELRREHGYEKVEIPHITKKELYEKSGHWDKFQEELLEIETREGHLFAMKPMNCPHHTQIYDRKLWSYRELPQRYANTTMCYRDEQTGELSGLSRARAFTQDDAHVFCRQDQIQEEFLKIWDIVDEFYKAVGFELKVNLSLHDPDESEKYLGTPEIWKEAENTLRDIAKERGVKAEEIIGEAAFYGPKIDFMANDSIGRQWQLATIQLDMNLPERFDLTCINEKGEKERIFMIHAAIMGSIERYLSILIEHFAGAFPLWLSPVQVKVLTISDKQNDYAQEVAKELKEEDIRVEIDNSNETIGKKIRETEMQKVPYIVIVGDKELKDKKIAVRKRSEGDIGVMSLDDFEERLEKEIEEKII